MNRQDVENGIQRTWALIDVNGLAESFSSPSCLGLDQEFRDAASAPETRYSELYLLGLRNSHYNILLSDHSYLQFGWSAQDDVRYAYYPNPFIPVTGAVVDFKRLRDLVSAGVLTFEEFHAAVSVGVPEARIPMLRYENSPGQYRPLRHPCSHLHIGHHSENRWAVSRILTPLAFAMIVLKQFYPLEWETFGDNDGDHNGNIFETQLIDERQNCRQIGDDFFSLVEARSFHWN